MEQLGTGLKHMRNKFNLHLHAGEEGLGTTQSPGPSSSSSAEKDALGKGKRNEAREKKEEFFYVLTELFPTILHKFKNM